MGDKWERAWEANNRLKWLEMSWNYSCRRKYKKTNKCSPLSNKANKNLKWLTNKQIQLAKP
jgi:hypothetical protein